MIGPFTSSPATLLESLSNEYLALPIVAPSAAAARVVYPPGLLDNSLGEEEGGAETLSSHLVGAQPDISAQMRAMARLILDMKAARDAVSGG